MDEFVEFLESRGIEEHYIMKVLDEKIDPTLVVNMSEENLNKFILKLGDRIAVRQYCEKFDALEKQSLTELSSIAKKVKDKVEKRKLGDSSSCSRSVKLTGNKNARKDERRFEIVWRNFDGVEFRQVRERNGGGTRHLKESKDISIMEIKEKAKELFFPSGVSKLGCLQEFEINLRDAADNVVSLEATLTQIYDKYKMKMLRLYLCTKKVCALEVPTNTRKLSAIEVSTKANEPETLEVPTNTSKPIDLERLTNPSESVALETVARNSEPFSSQASDNQYAEETEYDGLLEYMELMQETPYLELPTSRKEKIKLHRGHVFGDMNDAVNKGIINTDDVTYEVVMVLPNGEVEQGEDNGGVLRDALSEYWEVFYKKATKGHTLKVPMIRHDMKDTWATVAKILVWGYNVVRYFPIALAKPFLQHCFGESIDEVSLVETYLQFVPEYDRAIIERADFADEDFIDFLETHEVKTIVGEDNWTKVLREIAHKELIQEPAYVSECWGKILQCHLKPLIEDVQLLITSLTPNPKKVVSCLEFAEDMGPKEKSCAEFLKKFVRNSSADRLQRFLRFCTGADILVCNVIQVRFTEPQSEYTRTPVGHTCGCVLEIPNTYQSALELSEEFAELLTSNIWVMDII